MSAGRGGEARPDPLAIALVSEVVMTEQRLRIRLERALPRGMELSHFMVLNQLARQGAEKYPAQLARLFGVTKGAMTNTLRRLDAAGFVHIRPDWEDGRRKQVSLSPAGLAARERGVEAIGPLLEELVGSLGQERLRAALPVLRGLREALARPD